MKPTVTVKVRLPRHCSPRVRQPGASRGRSHKLSRSRRNARRRDQDGPFAAPRCGLLHRMSSPCYSAGPMQTAIPLSRPVTGRAIAVSAPSPTLHTEMQKRSSPALDETATLGARHLEWNLANPRESVDPTHWRNHGCGRRRSNVIPGPSRGGSLFAYFAGCIFFFFGDAAEDSKERVTHLGFSYPIENVERSQMMADLKSIAERYRDCERSELCEKSQGWASAAPCRDAANHVSAGRPVPDEIILIVASRRSDSSLRARPICPELECRESKLLIS